MPVRLGWNHAAGARVWPPEPGSAPVRDAGSGRASGILVTGQQPVLSVSLLITSISAARERLPVWATRRTDPATAGPAWAPPGPVRGERGPASRRRPAG